MGFFNRQQPETPPPTARHESTPPHTAYYNPLPYQKKSRILSAHEIEFYHVLCEILAPDLIICPKINLADIVYIPTGTEERHWETISQKYINFLICDPATSAPLCAIEFIDPQNPETYELEMLMNDICRSINLPLVRFNIRYQCTGRDIADLLYPYVEIGYQECLDDDL